MSDPHATLLLGDAGPPASPAPPESPAPDLRLLGSAPRPCSGRSEQDPASDDAQAADVDAARSGDHAAFARLVEATHRDTYALALHLTGCVEDARDVTQEAYLRAYRGLGSFRGDARFSTWMYRITANVAATQAGRNRRHRHDELADDSPIADPRPDHDPALAADAGDLRDRILVALGQLPPKLRAVIVLRFYDDLSVAKTAEALGCTEGTVKSQTSDALARLRTVLGDDVVPSTEGASHD